MATFQDIIKNQKNKPLTRFVAGLMYEGFAWGCIKDKAVKTFAVSANEVIEEIESCQSIVADSPCDGAPQPFYWD